MFLIPAFLTTSGISRGGGGGPGNEAMLVLPP